MTETPASQGYRMPAEWEPHSATWIAWPHNRRGLARASSGRSPGSTSRSSACSAGSSESRFWSRAMQGRSVEVGRETRPGRASTSSRVGLHRIKTDRVWTRDSGPTFVVKPTAGPADPEGLALVDWEFNAWAKYENHLARP